MNQQIIDAINGVEPDTSDKIMQCEVCSGFYPVPYYWVTLIRCHECGYLDIAHYNQKAKPEWKAPPDSISARLGY